MKACLKIVSVLMFAIFIGCGGGGGGGGSSDTPFDVVVVDGYIANATLKDADNTPVKYQSQDKKYHFYDTPKEYIKVSGGVFEGSGLKNKMLYSVPPNTAVISPVVQFMQQHPDSKEVLAKALQVGEYDLKIDYVKNKQLNIAKLAQIIYALEIHNLHGSFAQNIAKVENFNGILLAARDALLGHPKAEEMRAFFAAVDKETDVDSMEKNLYEKKSIMQQDVDDPNPNTPNPNTPNPSKDKLKVVSAKPVGNLKIEVEFSEDVNIDTEKEKNAFTLRQQTISNVAIDANKTINVTTSSVAIPLLEAITTENENYTYEVLVKDNFLSKEGLSLKNKTLDVSITPEKLAIEKVAFVDGRTIKATFNVAVDASSLRTNDFSVKHKDISYISSKLDVDKDDEKTIIITLGNTLTSDAGYELQIKGGALQNKTNTFTLEAEKMLTKEFIASTSANGTIEKGFNLINASVDSKQKNITLNFSKTIMDSPQKDMFEVKLKALTEPLDINITQQNAPSSMATITPATVLLSPENNDTSYVLSIAKQTIFSMDGARTFGITYKHNFDITTYPKVTNAALSGSKIDITFNMNMDLNASFVSVMSNGAEVNTTFSGSGTNYTVMDANGTDFNASSTTLTIKNGVKASDGMSILDSDYIKDFNGS